MGMAPEGQCLLRHSQQAGRAATRLSQVAHVSAEILSSLLQISIASGGSLLLSAPGVAGSPEQLLPVPASLTGIDTQPLAAGQMASFLLQCNATGAPAEPCGQL